MKKFRKSLGIMLAVLMLMASLSAFAFAADDSVKVTLRIEGISECLYYDTLETEKNASVLDVLEKADSLDDTLSVTVTNSQYGKYVSAINGESEKTFKGYDGWLFRVNGEEAALSAQYTLVSDGDSVVFYYGDPYGVGMQYPVADTSKLSDGEISFTSMDTTYDENWNAVTKECPVTDYSIIWGYGNGKSVKISSDENGVCKIDEQYLTSGSHSLQIEKYASNGCPLVLRYAPDYTVSVEVDAANAIATFFAKIVAFVKMVIETIVNLIESIGTTLG